MKTNLLNYLQLIYLDNNATTPIDPRVLDAMMPFLKDFYGNAASNHSFGVNINQHVKEAREQVARLLGCDTHEIIFTSGATEAINLALKGVAEQYKNKGNHIITLTTEHPAILDTCQYLERIGFEITYLPVNSDGLVDLNLVKASIRLDTILVSVMLANNETGVIQPIKELADITHEAGSIFMTDATQAVGKIPISVDDLGVDILTFSGHKFYAPKGVGGLFVRSRRPRKVTLGPLLHGGGHERGYRSGTLNVPGIVGIGKAAEIATSTMNSDAIKIKRLRDELESQLLSIEETFVNGNSENRLYNTSNICFRGADADAIMVGLSEIMVSNGSACTSNKVEPSHVIKALGMSDEIAYSSIRFSFGKYNTINDVITVCEQTKIIVESLRQMSH